MRTIGIANQKGGCGKTTTAINLAYSLSIRGQKVVLIDCDPQAHATMGLKVKPSGLEKNMYDVLTPTRSEAAGIDDIAVPVNEHFDLAPSSVILSAIEQELAGQPGREDRLLQAIRGLKQAYDYIIIDCPPSIGLLCVNALRACQEVIIPIDMSLFSLRGVAKLIELTMMLKDELGHAITSRALVTMYDSRTKYSRRVLEEVKGKFGENVFNTIIRYNIRLRETVDYGLPVGVYDKRSNGHNDYERLAEEVMCVAMAQAQVKEHAEPLSQDMLVKTEKYIDAVMKQPVPEGTVFDMEEILPPAYKSSYPEMVQAMGYGSLDAQSEDEIEFEEYKEEL